MLVLVQAMQRQLERREAAERMERDMANAQREQKPVLLPAAKGEGLEVRGAFVQEGGDLVGELTLENKGAGDVSGLFLQLNHNCIGVKPADPRIAVGTLQPGQRGSVSDLACNIRREGGRSLVTGGSSLVVL